MEFEDILNRVDNCQAQIGIIGLGYVGLPLVMAFADAGFHVIGFDIDQRKVDTLLRGQSYIRHINASRISELINGGQFEPTSDYNRLVEVDAMLICVPTPLTENREPDMSYIESTTKEIAKRLRPGQLISLESTTYPGTTEEVLLPQLEANGLKVGKDFFLAYSPEREDPGNPTHSTRSIPKVVGGVSPNCLQLASRVYEAAVDRVIPVSSTRAAELTKLLENIYRSVNIAMVNELKMLCQRMDINLHEVIDAAATKPFGFQPFHPGPGLGGHCIPIDPFYLTWKARQYDFSTRFIELAGDINTSMPYHVIERVTHALNDQSKSLKNARVLVLGVAYKRNVDDLRESPALKIIDLLSTYGAIVSYHDPYIPQIMKTRKFPHIDLISVPLDEQTIRNADCVLIVTDHHDVDYQKVVEAASLVVDTRYATGNLPPELKAKVIHA